MTDPACSCTVDVLAELALGVADAEARASALAHLERCAACRDELRGLGDTADALVALTPEVDPPDGFEERVVGCLLTARDAVPLPRRAAVHPLARTGRVRSGHHGAPRPAGAGGHRPTRRALTTVAAAVAVALGAVGWALSGAARGPVPNAAMTTGALVSGQHNVGEVVLVAWRSPWVSVAVHGETGVGWVRCELVERGGEVVTVGTFRLAGGSGHWAAAARTGSAQVRQALLVDTHTGRVVARAELAATS